MVSGNIHGAQVRLSSRFVEFCVGYSFRLPWVPAEAFLSYENSSLKVSNFSLVAFDSTAQSSYAVSVHSVKSFYLIIRAKGFFFRLRLS